MLGLGIVLSSVVRTARIVAVNDQYTEHDHSEVIKQMERNSSLANNHGGPHTHTGAVARALAHDESMTVSLWNLAELILHLQVTSKVLLQLKLLFRHGKLYKDDD
jgi:hypothetical protein